MITIHFCGHKSTRLMLQNCIIQGTRGKLIVGEKLAVKEKTSIKCFETDCYNFLSIRTFAKFLVMIKLIKEKSKPGDKVKT